MSIQFIKWCVIVIVLDCASVCINFKRKKIKNKWNNPFLLATSMNILVQMKELINLINIFEKKP